MAASGGMLMKKFKGSLLGGLVGDCLGATFKNAEIPATTSRGRIKQFFNSLKNGEFKPVSCYIAKLDYDFLGSLHYTDDTATTKELAASLTTNGKINKEDLAKRLTELYYAEPYRGYGIHIGDVFSSLRDQSSFSDVLKPAREQFNGTGSYGNGAAMRVTPIGLFFHKTPDEVAGNAEESACITHAHLNGINGAILQALAVREAIVADKNDPMDAMNFIDRLKEEIDCRERRLYHSSASTGPFTDKLKIIEKFLKESPNPPLSRVIQQLGNDVQALKSVPTAIYCFLVAQKPLDGIDTTNIFERMIQYILILGGDTDTIGNMAGGICGAYYGDDIIPKYLINPCEGYEEMANVAENLYEISTQ